MTSFKLGDDLPQERVFGLMWDVKEDAFRFQVPDRKVELTRRGVLSDVSSLYDPLKLLLQELCRDGIRWDDKLSDTLAERWLDWRERLSDLRRFKIPRCYGVGCSLLTPGIELHVFCDASESGYGACAYLRRKTMDGTVVTVLVSRSTDQATNFTTTRITGCSSGRTFVATRSARAYHQTR